MTREQQIQFIKDNYLELPAKRMAIILGRSDCFVFYNMKKLKLVVPENIKEKFIEGSKFKNGHKPHNKGNKQQEFMSQESIERTKKTRFKKGHEPHNIKYEGYISVRRNKKRGLAYKWIRIKKKYILLHRHIWEKHHGPISNNMNIQFKDGDTLNCDIDNLYEVSRKEQVTINKKYGGKKLPYNLHETAITITKINKRIKNHEKQNHRSK